MSSSVVVVSASIMAVVLVSASACDQRAPHAMQTGDASVTSVAVPVAVPVLVHQVDASVTPPSAPPTVATSPAPEPAAPTPRWVPDAATLTIVDAKDLDRNLGIAGDAGTL